MKKIEAIIRPSKLTDLEAALAEIDITGMTILNAAGLGRQTGYTELYRGKEYKINYLSKIKIEILIEDDKVYDCINRIMQSCRTGDIGDGKIIVTSVEQVVRIRTGEINSEAT